MREYKLTALMAATSFLLVSGLMTNNRQMYWMASVLGFILGATYLLVNRRMQHLKADLHCPPEVLEGESFEVTIETNLRVSWAVAISDFKIVHPPSFSMEHQRVEPRADGVQRIVSELTANRMGRYTLGEIAIVLSDIFGLFYRVAWFDLLAEVRVLPRPVPLAGWSWSGGGHGRFLMASSLRGQRGEGADWHGTRPYIPGDPLRRINWRATARHHEWHVKEFETDQLAPVLVAVEYAPRWRIDEDEGAPDFEQALRHLAWLATEAPRHGVALSVQDETGTVTPVAFSQSHEMRQFLRWLTDRTPTASQSVLDRLPSLIRQYGNQYRIVLLVPASVRAVYESAINPYRQQGYAVEVFGVSA